MDVSRLFIYALFIFGVLLPGSVIAQTDMLRLSITDRAQIEGMLANELENKLLSTAKFEGQSGQVNVHVRLAPSSGTVVVNLSREFVPYNTHYMTAEMEDSTSELANIVSELLRDIIKINGISFQIDGVNVDELFQEPTKNMLEGKNSYAAPAGSKSIVVSAGHGIYYHYGYNDWRAQRDPSNGIIEDFITPGYAAELGACLHREAERRYILRDRAAPWRMRQVVSLGGK